MKRLLGATFLLLVTLGVAAPDAARKPVVIAPGVTVAGIPVGGLTSEPARTRIEKRFFRPLRLVYGDKQWRISPRYLGASAGIDNAVAVALQSGPQARVPLHVSADSPRIRRYVQRLDRLFSREPVDATVLGVAGGRPNFSPTKDGLAVDREQMTNAIAYMLRAPARHPVRLLTKTVPAKVTPENFGPVIVIYRGSNKLTLFDGPRAVSTFGVATGQPQYPTPLGNYAIATMQRNPWWVPPPNSEWAQGEKPIPPGPGNPLGTRWMGTTAPLVGIHGTPDAASIGYSASHGCIRMRVPDAEALFNQVHVGTPVLIVPA
ncbi:MAG TPA: L,D-transpeptidase family protein [Gaiellaceae bacterium]|nr:L,D-transpeptidase family protein [Gaiellaceae bacterium]